jgi:hypothetical protein
VSPTEAFKVAFLMRCADEGLSIEQTHQRVKTALAKARSEKRAFIGSTLSGIGDLAGGLAQWGKPLMLTGLALPVAAGVMGGKILADAKKDPMTVDEAKTDEELSEIQRLTDRARRLKQLRAAQSQIGV